MVVSRMLKKRALGQALLSNIEQEHYQEVPEHLASRLWAKATYKGKERLKSHYSVKNVKRKASG